MGYKLIFSDEFNYEGKVDETKWTYETGGNGFGNKELQYYTDRLDNIFVKDGKLHIVGKKEKYENREYTSAKISTFNKKLFKYGRFEIKAKLPKGKGSWPAIWMLPTSIREGESWPLCGEIDIMEHVGRDQDTVHFSLHTGKYNHNNKTQYTKFLNIDSVSDKFFEYAMEWEEDRIEFFVDGKSLAKFERGEDGKDTTNEGWPFNKEYYLILNLAIGGNWGGTVDDSTLPYEMEIEYVRVYEKN